jgi:hypothetical protein
MRSKYFIGYIYIIVFGYLVFATENQNKEWKILNLQGAASALVGESLKNLMVGQVISGTKAIKVESGTLKLSKNSQEWLLFANSELDFIEDNPSLKKGSLRLIINEPMSFRIETPVAQVNLEGSDFLVTYNQDKALLEVFVFNGNARIKGIYRDEEQLLEKNSKGGFQGIMEKDGLSFDHMLKGKKVVRGDLLVNEKIKSEEIEKIKKTYYLENQKIAKKEKIKPKPGQICQDPFGKLNECVWHLNGGKCERRRCYANGSWGDMTLLPDKQYSLCGKSDIVAACDY